MYNYIQILSSLDHVLFNNWKKHGCFLIITIRSRNRNMFTSFSQVHYVWISTFVGFLWRLSKLYIFGDLIIWKIRKTMFPFAPSVILPPSWIFSKWPPWKRFRQCKSRFLFCLLLMIALSGSFKTFSKILHRILTFDLLHWPLTRIVHFTTECYSFDISCQIFILCALGDRTR